MNRAALPAVLAPLAVVAVVVLIGLLDPRAGVWAAAVGAVVLGSLP